MFRIKSIKAREILDSRGNPTVEVEIKLDNNRKAWAAVPSGASTGSHEAWELRDNDRRRYGGQGVLKVVYNVNKIIAPKLIGKDPFDQSEIDNLMIKLDGTGNKKRLGANAILGVSLANARIAAISQNLPTYQYLRKKFFSGLNVWRMPKPMMNIINGGVHANFSLDFQEFMIMPQQKKAKEMIRCGAEIFHNLGRILEAAGFQSLVGDEGGYAPRLKVNEEALKLIFQAIKKSGYNGNNVKIGVDAAASEIFKNSKYHLRTEKRFLTHSQLIRMYENWINKYPIASLEDGLAEDDWAGWQSLTAKLGKKVILVGDDLFVTDTMRLKKGVNEKVANAILIKLNQIGTVAETINCLKQAKENNYKIIISHRSGETTDDFITDLAVAANADYLKAGSLSRGERVTKYNRLMEIEEEIG